MQTKHYTGIVIESNKVEWTTLRELKGGLEVAGHGVESFVKPAEDEPVAALPMPEMRGSVCASISAHDALLRILTLPSTDMEELAGMVDLQVGKISPFPVEDMVVSFEVLTSEENSSLVLIAAVQRKYLDKLHEDGIPARHVDIDLIAWWHGLCAEGLTDKDGRVIYLFMREECADMIVAEDGAPLLLRSMLVRDDMSTQDYHDILVEEFHYTLTALEADWGPAHGTELVILNKDGIESGIESRFREGEEITVKTIAIDKLMPLSELLVRRRTEKNGHCIDLVPEDWRQSERDALIKHRLLRACGVFAIVWLTVFVSIFGYTQWEKSSAEKYAKCSKALQEPAKKSQEMQMRILALERYSDRTYSALGCLRETSVLLPGALELLSFSFKKESDVSLRGVADTTSATEIYNYFKLLENSGKFESLKGQKVSVANRRGVGRCSQFQVTLVLPKAGGETQ